MSADTADRLRALARDHLEGRSSLQSYRRQRAQLLDGLVAQAGKASPDATQPRAAAQVSETTQPRTAAQVGATTQPRAAAPRVAAVELPEPAPSDKRRMKLGRVIGYVALVLLFALPVGFFLWHRHPHGVATPAGTAPVSSAQTDPLRAVLEPLLQNPDWSDARLVALNQALLEAGQQRLDAARGTDWFDAFVESVRSRLLQQQALAGTALTPDNSPLAALAVTLGIALAAPAQPAASAAHFRESPPVQVPQKSGGQTKRAPPSLAPAQASESARTEPTRLARDGAHETVAVRAQPLQGNTASAEAASPGAAAAPKTSKSPSAKTSTPHEYAACSAALSQVRLNYCQDFLASGDAGPLLAVIPAGAFMMGNREEAAEGPVHRVTLAHAFAMSVYEVSQSEFQLYCRTAGKACPQQPWTRDDYPVVNVSWRDAEDYARWLSTATHQRYRLPTEAEWEYAARAGGEGLYPSGDSLSPTDAYFSMGATLTAPAPRSMRFNANAWHLMHMIGNAREWVADTWSPSFSGAPADGSARSQGEPDTRVARGGCYADPAIKLRLTTREPLQADTRDRCTGFRLVRELSP